MQLQAGYILDPVSHVLMSGPNKTQVKALLKQLSHFELLPDAANVVADFQIPSLEVKQICAVAEKIITRAMPCPTSLLIEQAFHTLLGKTLELKGQMVSHRFEDKFFVEYNTKLYRAFHVIDPRIQIDLLETPEKTWDDILKKYKHSMFTELLPDFYGEWLLQQIELNTSLKELAKYKSDYFLKSELLEKIPDEVVNSGVDFSIELPYAVNKKQGLHIELNDIEHDKMSVRLIDNQRDELSEAAEYEKTLRIRTENFHQVKKQLKPLDRFLEKEYFDLLRMNYINPLISSPEGIELLQFALTPIAIARLQRSLLQLILSGIFPIHQDKLKIAVYEQDVPCATMAFADILQMLEHITALAEVDFKLPDIELHIYHNPEFENSPLHQFAPKPSTICELTVYMHTISEATTDNVFDFAFDMSVLQRKSCKAIKTFATSGQFYAIRSVLSVRSVRKYESIPNINYKAFIHRKNLSAFSDFASKNAVEYFMRSVFRKRMMTEPQLQAASAILSGDSCLLSMPALSGKSIVAQLITLLQPGVCLFVSPNSGLDETNKIIFEENAIDLQRFRTRHTIIEREDSPFVLCNSTDFFQPAFQDFLREGSYNQIIFDQIQLISEWHEPFDPQYLTSIFIFKNIISEIKKNIKLVGVSHLTSYNAENDISAILNIARKHIVSDSQPDCSVEFSVQNIEPSTTKLLSEQLSKDIQNQKNAQTGKLLDKHIVTSSRISNVLVVMPFERGQWSIGDGKSGLTKHLNSRYGQVRFGTYVSRTISDFNTDDRTFISKADEVYARFSKHKLNALLSLPEILQMPLNFKVDNVILFQPLLSPELYLNLFRKLSFESMPTRYYLLQSTTEINHDFASYNRENLPDNILIDNSMDVLKVHEEVYMYMRMFSTSRKGVNKELTLLKELMKGILVPSVKNHELINNVVENNFAYRVQFDIVPDEEDSIKVSADDNQGIGTINFVTNEIVLDTSFSDPILGEEILNYIHIQILEYNAKNANVYQWLHEKSMQTVTKGIEQLLTEISVGEQNYIDIDFENNRMSLIYEWIDNQFSGEINYEVLHNLYKCSTDSSDFVKLLIEDEGLELNAHIELKNNIIEATNQIRDRQDTLVMLSRLLRLGVIEGFSIDQSVGKLRLVIQKHQDNYYIEKLCKILNVKQRLSYSDTMYLVNMMPGDTIVFKTVACFINFVYKEVAHQHFVHAKDLNTQMRKNLTGFPEYIVSYLRNNYWLGENPDNFGQVKNPDFTFVQQVLSRTKITHEAYCQLYQSSLKYLMNYVDNQWVFKLLAGYAHWIEGTEDNEETEEALMYMVDGIREYTTKSKIQTSENALVTLEKIHYYCNEIDTRDIATEQSVEELVLLKLHTEWLADFNKKFS